MLYGCWTFTYSFVLSRTSEDPGLAYAEFALRHSQPKQSAVQSELTSHAAGRKNSLQLWNGELCSTAACSSFGSKLAGPSQASLKTAQILESHRGSAQLLLARSQTQQTLRKAQEHAALTDSIVNGGLTHFSVACQQE